ncbi:two-component sensor histidine kinase [Nonomuraea phyllanthi]|uniref:histidine kinase n=1 Tax=Nonomuraea phyllanthi TaxID=2219224 RepID=A0A5C4VJJ6_9ACTN|nr:two-component sensor histidine kinase [Nonomuraea phyllanthi]QFY12792.1 two-component sensor histidine kinase [Nonomuraea phyllanthi]
MGDSKRIVYWIRRLSEIAMVGWLGMMLLLDLVVAFGTGGFQWLVPACGASGIAAVVLRRRYRIEGFCAMLALSFGTSLVIGATGLAGVPGMTETGSLLILTIGVLRHVEPVHRAAVLACVGLIVLMAEAVGRDYHNSGLAFSFLLFAGWSTAAGAGGYLRFQQERRVEAVHSVRRAERLELARELHDLVAHYITGIVVQAQAARTVAETSPQAVAPALDAIASAGSEALTSMRRMVTVLRTEDDAARKPGVTLADLRILTDRFSADGPKVAFEIGPGLNDHTLPPEVMTTLHRVLQEALTNVRKHASRTAWVEATLRRHERMVALRVRNFGAASDPRVSRLGGGFGLVGMAERVEALGGRLHAGPSAEGAWQVLAEFPLP